LVTSQIWAEASAGRHRIQEAADTPRRKRCPNRDLPVVSIESASLKAGSGIGASRRSRRCRSAVGPDGVPQPVIVKPAEDGYELVADERRWRAAQLPGESTIPALVDATLDRPDRSSSPSSRTSYVKTSARSNRRERSRPFSRICGRLEVCSQKRLRRSRADIVNTVRLLDLPDEAIDLIDAGEMSKGARQGHADRPRPSPTPQARSPSGRTRLVRPSTRGRDQPPTKTALRRPGTRSRPLHRGLPTPGRARER